MPLSFLNCRTVLPWWGGPPGPRPAPWPASAGIFQKPPKPARGPAAAQGGRPTNMVIPRWQRAVLSVLGVALLVAVLRLVVIFVERARTTEPPRPAAAPLPLSPDYYVFVPKSLVRNVNHVREFIGKPLWVRDGYRWTCSPGSEVLGPIEKLTVSRVFERGHQVWLEFLRDGRPCAVAISAGDQFYLDEIFFIKDPHEIYKDWTPETWKKIAERRLEPGMTETQITFAIGYGRPVEGRAGEPRTVVEYTAGDRHARVVYRYGVAKQIESLP